MKTLRKASGRLQQEMSADEREFRNLEETLIRRSGLLD